MSDRQLSVAVTDDEPTHRSSLQDRMRQLRKTALVVGAEHKTDAVDAFDAPPATGDNSMVLHDHDALDEETHEPKQVAAPATSELDWASVQELCADPRLDVVTGTAGWSRLRPGATTRPRIAATRRRRRGRGAETP